jgi:hypothetical protein
MQKFEFVIKNEKLKTFRLICMLIVVVNTLLFTGLIFDPVSRKNSMIALILLVLYTFFRFYKSKRSKTSFYFDEWVLFLVMMLWVAQDNYFLAVANMLLFVLYSASVDTTTYEFTNETIKQKNFPWKKYSWTQLSNVVLKDKILTMDFKDNRLFQVTVENEDIAEPVFNEYAREQIMQSSNNYHATHA